MNTNTTSRAADLPEALRLADLFELESDPESLYRLAAAELRRLHALAAGQATAAQPGVAYAALPEKYYLAGGEVPTWDAKQMRAFADATYALRASHGQAPAQHTRPCGVCGSDEPFTGTCGSRDPRALCKQPTPSPQAADSVTAPVPPPECETEAEKRAFAFGWFKALESERMKADNKKKDPL